MSAINQYERETIKNFFIRNGNFSGFNDSEPKLYNALAQAKYKGFPEEEIDPKAPGGMQTVFYNLMGFRNVNFKESTTGKIESYAVHLITLKVNEVKLTAREQSHLKEFIEYYGFQSEDEFSQVIKPLRFPKNTLSDILLTFSIYSYFLENRDEYKIREFITKLNLDNIYEAFTEENMEKIVEFVKKILPPIVESEEVEMMISGNQVAIPKDRKIMWKDLVITSTLGLKYKGLYQPMLQMGAFMHYKLHGNLLYLSPSVLATDDIYRRRYGFKNVLEFWNINNSDFPEMSHVKGYMVYPFYNLNGQFAPIDGPYKTTKLYCVWFTDDTYLITDVKMLEHVYRKIPQISFSDKYQSKYIPIGYRMPCVLMNNNLIPIAETLSIQPPRDNNYYNLTSYNLGMF